MYFYNYNNINIIIIGAYLISKNLKNVLKYYKKVTTIIIYKKFTL